MRGSNSSSSRSSSRSSSSNSNNRNSPDDNANLVEAAAEGTYTETVSRPDSIAPSWSPWMDASNDNNGVAESASTTLPKAILSNDCWKPIFDLELPQGRCVGIELHHPGDDHCDALTADKVANPSHWIHRMLHPQEVAYAVAQPQEKSRDSFFVGRLAMREALRREQTSALSSIMKDEYGRPIVPNGYLGSISHKHKMGVAIVKVKTTAADGDDDCSEGIGVDIEQATPQSRNIARKVLTPNEIEELGRLEVRRKADQSLWLSLFSASQSDGLVLCYSPMCCI